MDIDFEKAIKRLEDIARILETGDVSLLDALKLYEEGVILSKFCEKELDSAQQKIEYLTNFEIPDNIDEILEKINQDLIINKKENKKENEETEEDITKKSKKETKVGKKNKKETESQTNDLF